MARLPSLQNAHWHQVTGLGPSRFICGFCSTTISSSQGWSALTQANQFVGHLYVCPECQGPNFKHGNFQFPTAAFGTPVAHVPNDLNALYEEARSCTSANAFTAAVLLCRKMLMNIAVQEGAQAGDPFISYINFLSERGFVPPNGRHWVDHIRRRGNEATHEIALMAENDAKELLVFVEMLLRFIYEFPNMIPRQPK
jgi:hypothetical protein